MLEDAVKAIHFRRAYLQELESDRPVQLHSAQARALAPIYCLSRPAAVKLIAAWGAQAGAAETAPPEASDRKLCMPWAISLVLIDFFS